MLAWLSFLLVFLAFHPFPTPQTAILSFEGTTGCFACDDILKSCSLNGGINERATIMGGIWFYSVA